MKERLALIDTDTLIFILKANQKAIEKNREYLQLYGKIKISELTYYECL